MPDAPPTSPATGPTLPLRIPIDVVPDLPDVPAPSLASGSPTTKYSCTQFYAWNYGLAQMPVAGPVGTPARIVRLHAPSCTKVVAWVAERLGAIPVCPHTDTGSSNDVLIGKMIGLPVPGVIIDGTQVWQVAGVYSYALQVPPSDNDPLTAGSGPFDPSPSTANVLQLGQFSRTVIGPVPPVSGGAPLSISY
jgi:hypothetical protein